jgi:hypothetical protein
MAFRLSLPLLLAAIASLSSAFTPAQQYLPLHSEIGSKISTSRVSLASTADEDADASAATDTETKKDKATLGLITFDLDDTLYPVDPVFTAANQA